jgi:protein-S-isoprenylcysteine O-methyltransferase Ste14
MQKNEGRVGDLVEKMERGEIGSKEIIRELEKRKLTERDIMKYEAWGYVVWAILCFLPAIAKLSNLDILSFLTQLPTIEFPAIVIYLSVALFLAVTPITASGMYHNVKHGGCHSEDQTIILLKRGVYMIMRHPSHLAWSVFFSMLPIMLSGFVPFTPLSAIAMVVIFALHYHASIKEERLLDIPKWGDDYVRYMREVPRWNFIKGAWNLRKKRKNSHQDTHTNRQQHPPPPPRD